MGIDDVLDPVPVDPDEGEAAAMAARTRAVVNELASDKLGHRNAARIDALVDAWQARYDARAAVEAERHRETTRLNDLFEFETGRRAKWAGRHGMLEESFDKFVREQKEAKAQAEADAFNAELEKAETVRQVKADLVAREIDNERVERAARRGERDAYRARYGPRVLPGIVAHGGRT